MTQREMILEAMKSEKNEEVKVNARDRVEG